MVCACVCVCVCAHEKLVVETTSAVFHVHLPGMRATVCVCVRVGCPFQTMVKELSSKQPYGALTLVRTKSGLGIQQVLAGPFPVL